MVGVMKPLGYVVVEYNQASGNPTVMDGSFSEYVEDVEASAENYREILAKARGEAYEVAAVVRLEDS